MKKTSCLMALLSLMCISAFAQERKTERPFIGIKGGLNYTNYNIMDADFDLKSNTGYHIGLLGSIPLGNTFSIQPEAYYSIEKLEGDSNILDYTDVDLAYLDVPIFLSFSLSKRLKIQAGPQFRIKAKTNVTLTDTTFELDENLKENLENDFNDMNFNVTGGLQYKLPIIGLLLQARFSYGITDINSQNLTNNQFLLSVGKRW